MKYPLAGYTILLPIGAAVGAQGTFVNDPAFGRFCHVSFPLIQTAVFMVVEMIFEFILYALFIIPLRKILHQKQTEFVQTAPTASPLLTVPLEKKIRVLHDTQVSGIRTSLVLLSANIIGSVLFILAADQLQGSTEIIVSGLISLLFHVQVYAMRASWIMEEQLSPDDSMNVDSKAPLAR
eukprot:TRINITY_DN19558_c0_g2_i1.p1 TRINITY_DN19558_c0_g2~~TRINITY_DN19558_c0_g2_i1.p1  ORF type:complete len:201 (+),score=44.78 TRINITY_DN19558_c0_g2_i1:64-603(+)